MPIRGMLEGGAFNPRDIAEMVAAFESTLAALNLVDRTDPVTNLVAKVIIDCAKSGKIDRIRVTRLRAGSRHQALEIAYLHDWNPMGRAARSERLDAPSTGMRFWNS